MGDLVQLASLATDTSAKPWVLVTHQRPDTDALCCLWAADRFIVPSGTERRVAFIEAGEHYELEAGECAEVLNMDVGDGPCDQHGKRLVRGSSFQLLLQEYKLNDPALASILELTLKTDNVERVEPTSIHYVFKGLPNYFKDSGEDARTKLVEQAFMMLDIIYNQERNRVNARERFAKNGRMHQLKNGLVLATVFWEPNLREAAFEAGAHVVMWTAKRDGRFEVGIAVSRDARAVSLRGAIRAIRIAEARKRGLDVRNEDLGSLGTLSCLPGWFLHDSDKLILSGSRSRRLQGDEYTMLTPGEVLMAIREPLSKLRG